MGKIKDLPVLERPREKAYRYGIEQLSDYELISLLIGYGCRDNSASDIAYEMIRDSGGLYNLVQKPYTDLINFKGIGKNKAIKIIACFEIAKRFQLKREDNQEESNIDSNYIYQRMIPRLLDLKQEQLYLIILDKKKKIVHEVNLYKGNEHSVNYSKLHILQQVIMHNGTYFYIVHNHPSGVLEPSENDIFFTSQIISEGKKIGITMVDHLIVSKDGYYSFLNSSPVRPYLFESN